MLSQLEQACKTYSTESSSGLIEFDSNCQHIFVTALTFHLDQAIAISQMFNHVQLHVHWMHLLNTRICRYIYAGIPAYI